MQQLKSAELKGWSKEDIQASMAFQPADTHALAVFDQVNELSLDVDEIFYNAPAGVLYEQALKYEEGSQIVSSGALAVRSGKKNRPVAVG